MKKNIIILLTALSIILNNSLLQAQKTNQLMRHPYIPERIQKKRAMPYQHVREADAGWSKQVVRKIDLYQKKNHKLYYPEHKMEDAGRYSLIDLLLYGIEHEGLTAYYASPLQTNIFKQEISLEEIKTDLGSEPITIVLDDVGNKTKKVIQSDINTFDVKEYLVKEEWFYDKQRSVLDVRIIALCPVRYFYKNGNITGDEPVTKKMLFWVYFPEARPLLSTHQVLNPCNEIASQSFEDVFMKRRFSGYIVQENNIYNNRFVSEYTSGKETLYEANRIKNKMFDFEQELWEY